MPDSKMLRLKLLEVLNTIPSANISSKLDKYLNSTCLKEKNLADKVYDLRFEWRKQHQYISVTLVDVLKHLIQKEEMDTQLVSFVQELLTENISMVNRTTSVMEESTKYILFHVSQEDIKLFMKVPDTETFPPGFYVAPLSHHIEEDFKKGTLFLTKLLQRYYGHDYIPVYLGSFQDSTKSLKFATEQKATKHMLVDTQEDFVQALKLLKDQTKNLKKKLQSVNTYKMLLPIQIILFKNMKSRLIHTQSPYVAMAEQFFVERVYDQDQLRNEYIHSVLTTDDSLENPLLTKEQVDEVLEQSNAITTVEQETNTEKAKPMQNNAPDHDENREQLLPSVGPSPLSDTVSSSHAVIQAANSLPSTDAVNQEQNETRFLTHRQLQEKVFQPKDN